jgi:cell division protein FtsQ
MADVLTGESYASRNARREEQRPDRSRLVQRVLLALVIVLALALTGELVYHLVIAPRLAITAIQIEGDIGLPEEEILAVAGLRVGMMYFRLDESEIAARLESIPVVRQATVERVFPNRVTVQLVRRQPVAYALVATPEGEVPLVFDEEGVVFGVGRSALTTDMPVISGLRFPEARAGLQLPEVLEAFLGDLHRLQVSAPEIYGLWSEFRVVRKNDYVYEVVMYPMHVPLPVRVGARIDEGMIQYILMMLDMLQREGKLAGAEELDFRTGEGVLRLTGARSSAVQSQEDERG